LVIVKERGAEIFSEIRPLSIPFPANCVPNCQLMKKLALANSHKMGDGQIFQKSPRLSL
jgi:hypothetical protein